MIIWRHRTHQINSLALPKAGKFRTELAELIRQIEGLECGMVLNVEDDQYVYFYDPHSVSAALKHSANMMGILPEELAPYMEEDEEYELPDEEFELPDEEDELFTEPDGPVEGEDDIYEEELSDPEVGAVIVEEEVNPAASSGQQDMSAIGST